MYLCRERNSTRRRRMMTSNSISQCCQSVNRCSSVSTNENDIPLTIEKMNRVNLGCVWIDFKLIPEIHFRKMGCLVVTSNSVKLKSISSRPNFRAKTQEMNFCFYFHFKWLLALENRREREREGESKKRSRSRRHRTDCVKRRSASITIDASRLRHHRLVR